MPKGTTSFFQKSDNNNRKSGDMPDRKAQLPFQDLLSYEYYNTGIFFLSNLFHRKKMTPFDNSVTVQPCEDSDRKKLKVLLYALV